MTVSSVMSRPTPKASSRVRNWAIAIAATLGAFVLLVIVTTQLPPSPQEWPSSTENMRADGAKAVAQVLRANGVAVDEVTVLDDAITAARPGTTLVIVLRELLSDTALARLDSVPADLVVIVTSPSQSSVEDLTEDRVSASRLYGTPKTVFPECEDPDAVAAGSAFQGQVVLYADYDDSGINRCFDPYSSLYVDLRTDAHRVSVLAGTQFVRNDSITQEGHAALALRVLGRNPTLTWYLPSEDALPGADDPQVQSSNVIWKMFPGWAGPALAILLAAGAAAAFWRGRRFGKLVPEALPVAVPASEAAAGLGRLYRQSHACGHAGAALRAACAARLASRFGLPASAAPDVVCSRLSDALHVSPDLVQHLVYGPPPATDADLLVLAANLRQLEDGQFVQSSVSPTSTVGGS